MNNKQKLDYGFIPEHEGLTPNKAADNNKSAIFEQLSPKLAAGDSVFEIGSGTCQHAIYFCRKRNNITWYPSDTKEKQTDAINWLHVAKQNNILPWQNFTLGDNDKLNLKSFSIVYTANTLHIMPHSLSQRLIEKTNTELSCGSKLFIYGPFKQNGTFTTPSNAEFNDWLLAEGYGGMLDIDDLVGWAPKLALTNIIPMPANNFLLTFEK